MTLHQEDRVYQTVCALTSARAIVSALDAHKAAYGIAPGVVQTLTTSVNALMLDAIGNDHELRWDHEVTRARDLLQHALKELVR